MLSLHEAQLIVAKAIDNIEYSNSPVELYDPMRYILGLGGKRIRPAITLLACNVYADDVSPAIDAAIALEIFHNFTLVHDDIMDNAQLRRNQPTIHAKWNNNVAILSGDGMCIKAYEQLAKCPAKYLKQVFEIFNKTALEVCEGQQYDMNFEHRDTVTLHEYLHMIGLKTSVLLAACLKIGAITGGASEKDANAMYQFGLNMGLAFQLQDDLLDVFGNQDIFGKEIGKDILSNKKTFLLISAFERANNLQKVELLKWTKLKSYNRDEKIFAVTELYKQLNIEHITKIEIDTYFQKAISSFNTINVPEHRKTELLAFLNELKIRNK